MRPIYNWKLKPVIIVGFYCLEIFAPAAITEWTEDNSNNERTALCADWVVLILMHYFNLWKKKVQQW